ncbi:Centromere protein Cenp-O [Penicillium taxi]|uniref:Centromere protein Cenp-O n=1 Tax=Penicillium taxi TaxID=168475 RepID=UPI00254504F9|nr:Centromere protein Cenp-O [Penicillium taxi]KAJ5885083.1 Centromere protein Cenp-O [Penicillium taxi]
MSQFMRHSITSPDPHEEELDIEITSIRAESKHSIKPIYQAAISPNQPIFPVQKLQRRKRFLASSLLSSDSVKKLLRKPTPALTSIHDEISPLARAADKHSESNHYRIAFGTTAFPFKDPSSTASSKNMLGVRIDVCARNGKFQKPYYILLKRERNGTEKEKKFKVHRHTIPAFISMSKLESAYLPSSKRGHEDEECREGIALKPWKASQVRKQDLRGFVRELRRELVAWHLRTDAIAHLRERLGLEDDTSSQSERVSPETKAGLISLEATAIEASYVRVEWEDGRVGRFKLTSGGVVERAVVIGDQGRDKQTEDAMTGQGGRVETLLERLKEFGSAQAS